MNMEAASTTGKPSSKGVCRSALGDWKCPGCFGPVPPVLPFVLAAERRAALGFLSSYIGALRHTFGGFCSLHALGSYQSRRASQCNCKRVFLSQVVLWVSALIVAIRFCFRRHSADLVERLL